jgi:hypothetical protein
MGERQAKAWSQGALLRRHWLSSMPLLLMPLLLLLLLPVEVAVMMTVVCGEAALLLQALLE